MNVPIVNFEDQIIGHKERDAINFDTDIFRTASLWITNSKDEVLLAQRKYNKRVDPGKWAEAVGGTVEGDDSYEETVRREAEEELGLKNISIMLGPKQLITTPGRYFVQWFTTTIDQDIAAFIIQEDEVKQIAWIPQKQLLQKLQIQPSKYIPAMKDIVELFVIPGVGTKSP